MTGGASTLPGLHNMISQLIPNSVRVGSPGNHRGLPDELKAPAYATGVGILLWGLKQERAVIRSEESAGRFFHSDRNFLSRSLTQIKGFLMRNSRH